MTMKKPLATTLAIPMVLAVSTSCAGPAGEPGPAGEGCSTVRDEVAGTVTITCGDDVVVVEDGSDGTVGSDGAPGTPGTDGAPGAPCTATPLPNDQFAITCPGSDPVVVDGADACDATSAPITLRTPADLDIVRGCRTVIGDLTVEGPYTTADYEAFAALRVVTGQVSFSGAPAGALSLPTLEFVGSGFYVSRSAITAVSAPALRQVSDLYFDVSPIATVTLSALERTFDGGIGLEELPLTAVSMPALREVDSLFFQTLDLGALSLPALTTVGGNDLFIEDTAIATLSLPALTQVDSSLSIFTNPALTSIALPALTSVNNSLSIDDNDALTTVSAPLLADVDDGIAITNLAALTSIAFPALQETGDSLVIESNALLTTAAFPALARIGNGFTVVENPALTTVDFDELRAVLDETTIADNPLIAICSFPVSAFTGGFTFTDNLPADGAACDNCPDIANDDQADLDFDDVGDACDDDRDGDTVANADDADPDNARRCRDTDADGCDDCAALGRADPANDGVDADANGLCERQVLVLLPGDDCRFEANQTLLFCAAGRTFADAQANCAAHNGRVVEPRDAATVAAVSGFNGAWVGLTDVAVEGAFVYASDGASPVITIPFAPGEPNNIGNEDCVQSGIGGWNDINCGAGLTSLCEAAPATPPTPTP